MSDPFPYSPSLVDSSKSWLAGVVERMLVNLPRTFN